MDAIARNLPRHLAAAVLGLLTFAVLVKLGVITIAGLAAAVATGVLILVLAAATFTPLLDGASQGRSATSTAPHGRADLDRWLRSHAARGSLHAPTDLLARRASRFLRRSVGRVELCAALERLDADRVVAASRSGGAA